jgi:hypothetical protein
MATKNEQQWHFTDIMVEKNHEYRKINKRIRPLVFFTAEVLA